MIATAARAAELPSTIDLVTTSYQGEVGQKILEHESHSGKRLGFNGKQVIHPSQVDLVQRIFAPESSEVEWAIRIIAADNKASDAGRGAWTLDGKMIDLPVIAKAQALLKRAERCGMNLAPLQERWKGQEPE